MPLLPANPLPDDLASFNCWWDADNIAQHILASWLGPIPHGLLPSTMVATCTALSIYKMLVQYYGTCSYADCADLANSLYSSICVHGRVQDYISKWRVRISHLQSAQFLFSIKMCLNQFVCSLPLITTFTSLCSTLPECIATAGDNDYGAFVELTEAVLEQDTIFCAALQAPRPNPHFLSATTTTSIPSAFPANTSSVSAPVSTDAHTHPS